MNFGDLGKKAEQFLDSDQGEKRSDDVLQRGEQFADEHIGQRDGGDQTG